MIINPFIHELALGAPLAEYRFNNTLMNTGTGGAMFSGSPSYSTDSYEGSHSHSSGSLTYGGGGTTFLGQAEFIFEFWIKPTTLPTAGSYHAIATRRASFTTQVFSLYFNGDTNTLTFEFNTSGSGPPSHLMSISNSLFPTGTWTHFRLSRAGGAFHMLVNGVLQTSYTAGQLSTDNIGAYILGSAAMTALSAKYDLLRFYDTIGSSANFTPPTS